MNSHRVLLVRLASLFFLPFATLDLSPMNVNREIALAITMHTERKDAPPETAGGD